MKTSLLKVMKAVALASMTIMLANCSNSGGGSSTSTVGTYAVSANYCTVGGTSGYQLINGICYVNGVQQSSTSLCTSYGATSYTSSGGTCYATTTNSGYTYVNGLCYQTSTGTYVSTSYCTSSSVGCNGTYYYSNGYSLGTINCSSSSSVYARNLGSNAAIISYASSGTTLNCSGLTLYSSASTYATITCQ
ncbi:MAG TPA: hypothetical protein VF412_03435 [Bdellovibrio sp.]|uniref:hypothetical protein n=1 Tax=Bdellovibrio sp. TaxID=28201 RepID=UPI002EDC98BE